jgi:putative ABC transport system ATP-binding protein
MNLFTELNERSGVTVIIVTHEPDIARCAKRILTVRDGRILSDTAAGGTTGVQN